MSETTRRAEEEPVLPPIVYAEASVLSSGGVSLFSQEVPVTEETVPGFYSERGLVGEAVDQLREVGFEVLQTARTTVTIAGPPGLYEDAFRTSIVAEERTTIKYYGREDTATFLECPDTEVPGLIDASESRLSETIEGVALNEPVYPLAFANPPVKEYWHLDVPAGVSLGINADRVHRSGITGSGVRVVMVDTGWHRHPFFVERGYRTGAVKLGPGAQDPDVDEDGHGTGESANVFAVAPDVEFTMVKMGPINSTGAFKAAVALGPDIISCSWGRSRPFAPLSAADQALAAAVASAVRQGIITVFAAGNGHWAFPGQHPDVLSAGGVFAHPDGSLEASDYASGFASPIYPGRNVPDVCGMVGKMPEARYIMLPVQPGGKADDTGAGGEHPDLDETAPGDGWAVFSGTSAAAPQLAGVCALMKQASPDLSPLQARNALKQTARDVVLGRCSASTGANQATTGPDLATGHGLTDALQAVMAVSGP